MAFTNINNIVSVATGDITDGTIANADISASAAIAVSKLATLTADRAVITSGAGVLTVVVPVADGTVTPVTSITTSKGIITAIS